MSHIFEGILFFRKLISWCICTYMRKLTRPMMKVTRCLKTNSPLSEPSLSERPGAQIGWHHCTPNTTAIHIHSRNYITSKNKWCKEYKYTAELKSGWDEVVLTFIPARMLVMKVISVNFVPNVNFLLSCIKSDPGEYFSRPLVRIREMVTEHY